MEIDRDEIVVMYFPSKTSTDAILKACEEAGFPATIVSEAVASESKSQSSPAVKEFVPPDFYAQALSAAKLENKPVVLDFMATWCAPCKRLSEETFVDESVAQLLKQCIVLTIDTDEHPDIAKHFDVSALPDLRFLTPNGEENKQLIGFQEPEPFASELRELLNQSKK